MPRGLFITFEGVEGSGKTTQVELLGQALASRDPVLVREPGGTQLGEKVREVLLFGGMDLDPEAEMHLFMAARSQLIREVITPSLDAGLIVIADRYHDSTVAYQGGGRGVATYWPPTFPKPDITFLLALPVEEGTSRQVRMGKHADRMEGESLDFHQHVAAAYARIAEDEPDRFVVLEGGDAPTNVHAAVMARVEQALASIPRK